MAELPKDESLVSSAFYFQTTVGEKMAITFLG
jgi:hypothetical protein